MVFVISFAPHPTTGRLERESNRGCSTSRARQFSKYDFPRCRGRRNAAHWLNNLPGGAPERIKRGKEKVVTRAVANAEMRFSGISERGNTALSELK